MAIMGIYAGASANGVAELPSPVEVKPTREIIWSKNTGRAQETSGTPGKMIGDVVAEKKTYAIKWGIITGTDLTTITGKLTAGFFYFAMATSLDNAKNNAVEYYRSEISYDVIQVGTTTYYKDVSVSVIQR